MNTYAEASSEYVNAHIIDVNNYVSVKPFKKSSLGNTYDKYKDENGDVYLIEKQSNNENGSKYVIMDKIKWHNLISPNNFPCDTTPLQHQSSNNKAPINYKFITLILIAVIIVMYFYNIYKQESIRIENERIENERIESEAIALDVKIDSIGKVTAEDSSLISECRTLYNNAEYEVQKSITSLHVLTEAERLIDLINQNPLPAHGSTLVTHKDSKRKPLPPLAIDLSECSDSDYYYIKLLDYNTNELKQTLFMHPKTSIEIVIPAGDYKMIYASGDTWYGNEEVFGKDGYYEKSEEKLSFTQDSKGAYGHTFQLYPVENGNFDTTSISPEEFRNNK